MAQCLLDGVRMRHFLLAAASCIAFTSTVAADTRQVTDVAAAETLDSVLEHVVSSSELSKARGVRSGARGTIEVIKDSAKPIIRGRVVVGSAPTQHERTIDWNFNTNLGTFESVRGEGSDTHRLTVTATADHKLQVYKLSGGQIERETSIETKTVKLVDGKSVPIVTTKEQIVIANQTAAVHFAATGQPKQLVKSGYTKSVTASGGETYTRTAIQIGGQSVTPTELEAFLKKRVAAR